GSGPAERAARRRSAGPRTTASLTPKRRKEDSRRKEPEGIEEPRQPEGRLRGRVAGQSPVSLLRARRRHRGIARCRRAVQRRRALAYASSTEPMDGRTPASRPRLPEATPVYRRPWSEC